MLPCLSKSALLFVLNQAKKPVNHWRLYIYLLWNYKISMSIHVNLYLKQSDVTLIRRVQHSRNRLGAETIAALLQMHRSWNALPDRYRNQCESFNPLTWVWKKICTANRVWVKQTLLGTLLCMSMISNFVVLHYLAWWERIQIEHERSKDWALRDSVCNRGPVSFMVAMLAIALLNVF